MATPDRCSCCGRGSAVESVGGEPPVQTTHAEGCWEWGPKHYKCAVREIKALRAERKRAAAAQAELHGEAEDRADKLAEALEDLITWVPSADTYRRLGFDPEAPMRALGKARAALAKENSND